VRERVARAHDSPAPICYFNRLERCRLQGMKEQQVPPLCSE
jgi:hypothetical protein